MRIKAFVEILFGEFSWSPPGWLRRLGVRRVGWGALSAAVIIALAVSGYFYYQSLPKPLQVVIEVTPPEISAIVDEKPEPNPAYLEFHYPPTANDSPDDRPALSAARLDLVGEIIRDDVELRPAMPGEWRFETENRLVFRPEEDWPADRTYRVKLARDLFAPGVRLKETEAEFTTPAFAATVTGGEFFQHPEETSERRVIASFKFSHPVSRPDFQQRLNMSMREGLGEAGAERTLQTRVEYGPAGRTAHVHSGIVAIPERENFVTVSVASGLRPENGDGDRALDQALSVQVRVPDRASYFRVRDVAASIVDDTEENPVQTAVVRFTDQVNTEDFASRIRAWVLPRHRDSDEPADSIYRWASPRQVTADVLAQSEPLELAVNPTQRAASILQSVTFDAAEGRTLYFRIDNGLTSKGGFVLGSSYDDVIRAPAYPKEASIAQEGALLPLTGNRLLTFSARGVSAVRVEVQQLLPATLNHLVSQTAGDIRDPRFHYSIRADDLTTLTTRFIDLNPRHPREEMFATLDLDPFLDNGGLFIVKVQGWDPENERALGTFDRRLALVTDLGLLVKTNIDKSQHAFVHSIATGQPLAGAHVDLLGRNGLPVLSAVTDARGHARLESAAEFKRGQYPTVLVVRHNGDVSFVPYRRHDRRLNWSGFDTGGEHLRAGDPERLKAALYTDRGLYRPGETVQLFGVVRRGDFESVPDAPVELRVRNARSGIAQRRRVRLAADGLVTWRFETHPESPTGSYRASIFLVDDDDRLQSLGGTSFSVEDYQPDRLRIRTAIMESPAKDSPERGWLQPGTHFARVNLQNLFGTPAQGRRVRGTLELQPMSPRFPEHPGFIFTDPFRDPETTPRKVTLELDEAATGDDGTARLDFDLGQYDNGIYRLLLTAEGFETSGGRGVKALAGTFMSPADALVGYKVDGELDFIALNGKRTLRFQAIDRRLAPLALNGLQAILYQRRYVSALVRQPNGAYAYQSVVKESEVERAPLALAAEGVEHTLPTSQPGRYALELVDADGVKLSRVEFAVAGAGNLAGNLEQNAELDIKLDRSQYRPGEEILLEITAPYAGTGLVTIERDRVHAFEWFHSDTSTTMVRITVPEHLEGNAYVNVALVRDIDSEEIFVSPLSYAVAPFRIDRSARRVDIELTAPEQALPGDRLVLGYATPEPSRLILFAVDEGILQVARYQTPDPLESFLRKKALQVVTHQMVDLIMPDYEVVRRASAPGGGDSARLLGANLNPFRRRSEPPVALWAGIHEAGPERREVSFEIPDYFNGELRVMAMAVGAGKLGAKATPVTVRGPIVLTPNLPLAVAPNDRFDVSVGVANNVEGSGADAQISLAATTLERLAVAGDALPAIAIAEGDEGHATLSLRARSAPGEASTTLVAELGDVRVRRRASLSVRPAVPFQTTVASGFDADGVTTIGLPRRLHESFARQQVTVSRSPLVLAGGLLEYLENFPHTCVEQMVSKTFPQLGLLQAKSFELDRAAYDARFRETVKLLRGRQNADGGFLFWSTSAESAPFPSVYVSHFLIDARELGMAVPDDMLNRATDYLRRIAGATAGELQSRNNLAAARTRAYAIYLLTRRGQVTTNYLVALREALQDAFGNAWRRDIASAYMAASHALLRNATLAERLIDGYQPGEASRPDSDFDTLLGRDAQYLYLVARHFKEHLARLDGDKVRKLVQPVFDNRFNTLSAAYIVLGLGEMHRTLLEDDVPAPVGIIAHGQGGPVEVDVTRGEFTRALLPVGVDRVTVNGASAGGVYYTLSQSGFDAEAHDGAHAEGIEVDRVYLDAGGEPVDRVRVGDELTVRLRLRSQRGRVHNVAVTDLLPGGVEIVTESLRDRSTYRLGEYRELRDDRLVLYGGVDERMKEITYRVRATAPGEFMVPAAYAEAMYNRGVRGRSVGGRLIVDRQ